MRGRRLVLRKEVLTELTAGELAHVVGAAAVPTLPLAACFSVTCGASCNATCFD